MRHASAVSLLVVLLGFLDVASTAAQTADSGALTCLAKDPSGAAIVGADVSATNQRTSEKHGAVTGPTGSARIAPLAPGPYRLEISAKGFATTVVPDIAVNVAEDSAVEVTLKLGATNEAITVKAEENLTDTESSTIGGLVNDKTITSLPLVSRNYTQILALSPGVVTDVFDATVLGRNSSSIHDNGASMADNNFQMNGVEINNIASNIPGDYGGVGGISIPNPDAIQEFNVQTALYDASYGRNGGANVDVVTKSGTNSFHGALFEFFRNNVLNANDYFFNLAGQPRPVLRQNQFGADLGGPVIKDKFFFFASYQGTRQLNGASPTSESTVLLPPLTNDRSAAAIGAIFAGQSGGLGGVAVAADGSNINPVALSILNAKLPSGQYIYPTPQVIMANGQGFSAFSIPATWTEDQGVATLDYIFDPKNKLSAHYFYSRNLEQEPFPAYAGNLPGFSGFFNYHNQDVVLGYTFTPGGGFVNNFKLAYDRIGGSNTAQISLTNSDVGITGTTNNDLITLFPGAYAGLGPRPSHDTISTVNDWSFIDDLFWNRGRHSFKVGGSYTYSWYGLNLNTTSYQELYFLGFPDFLLGQSGAQNGSGFSNIYEEIGNQGFTNRTWPIHDYSLYFQDDIKVSTRLTVNAGLRWEYFGGIADNRGRLSNFWTEAANPDPPASGTFAGYVVPHNFTYPVPPGVIRTGNDFATNSPPLTNFGPRVGFAFQPTNSSNLVLRGGYGIYYNRPTANLTLEPMFSLPFNLLEFNYGSSIAQATLQQPFNPPFPPLSAFPMFVPLSPTSDLTGYALAKNFTAPMVSQYSFNVQYEFAKDFRLDAAYVGTRGWRLLVTRYRNEALLATPENPVRGLTTSTLENIGERYPIIGVDPSYDFYETSGQAKYDALQLGLTKRYSRGLQFQVSYTWSKTLTNVFSDFQNGGEYFGNQNDPIWGVAEYARPQRLVISYVYNFPTAFGAHGFRGKALSGWGVSGVTTFQSGHPLLLTDSLGGSIYAAVPGTSPAELIPGVPIETSGSVTSRLSNYFNQAAFGPLPMIGDGTDFGNAMPGKVRGPAQNNFDIAILKSTSLTDRFNLQFRWEFFNAFNTPQFSDPITDPSTGALGQITSTSVNPRIMQAALKLMF
jgi:hypothetical protein